MLVKSTNDYGILLTMLVSPLEQVECEILRKATKGMGTTEEWIYPITFSEKYGDDLVDVLSKDLSGDLKTIILTAMRGEVADFSASIYTSAKIVADADTLYNISKSSKSLDKTSFINMLVLSPAEHVRNINNEYMAKYKTDLVSAVEATFSGDAKSALLYLVRSVMEPMELLAESFEMTLKSASTKTYILSAWIVRYYRLLVQIRVVYRQLYGQELRTRIENEVSGEYCQLLLSVIDAAEAEFGAFASKSDSQCDVMSSPSTVPSGSNTAIMSGAVIDAAVLDDKTSKSSKADAHASDTASSSSVLTSAVRGDKSSVVTASSAALRSLYTRYVHEGSSIESMEFSADIDEAVQEIQRVCTESSSDETALASLLLSKSAEQRYLIWWRYRSLYKQSLSMLVKSTNDYGILLTMLVSPLEQVECEILRKATKGMGTTEEWIYPIVMARSNAEITVLKKTFTAT
ncbi:putative annexin [Plasmopara halstedii]